VLNAYETALGSTSNGVCRHRIEHCMVVRDDQIERMRSHGFLATIQLTWFQSDWTPEVDQTLGPNRLAWAGRWREFMAAGIPTMGSTDAPWAVRDNLNGTPGPALKAIYRAVTRIGEASTPPAAWMRASA
jgi:predicted amidohydrolase YtcJ